jgi:hypothetical protein|tara:strand:- start:1 stop:177 length:177 start_codon:yes stop_codon:yes gene_type:complete
LAYYNGACSASLIGKKEFALEYLENQLKKDLQIYGIYRTILILKILMRPKNGKEYWKN